MARKSATDPELTTVHGLMGDYRADTVQAVDESLLAIAVKIATSGSDGDVDKYKKDRDQLLELRLLLQLTAD